MAQKQTNTNIQVSFGIQGMERMAFQHLIDEKVFTFQRNGNIETDTESLALTNEHSNLLCSKFKPGYMVIGVKYDTLNSKIWFFITEKKPDLNGKRKSEIGFIKINSTITDESDLEIECGCDMVSILSEPLENTTQIPYCTYTTLIGDDCNNCLNFDPNYPIYNIILKQEACGYTMTFASKNNPPRYIIVDKIDYYTYTGDINCGIDNTEDTCLDCDKLRVFPLYDQPYVFPELINYGGSLRRGTYEFFIAYCDKMGNEISSYISATNPITIFDESNIKLDQTTRFSESNFAIKLKVDNLDRKFNFYKVAVIERTDVSEITSAFEEGIHSITDINILYTRNGSEGDKRISINRLFVEKPVYKNFGGLVSSNGYLFGYDYEVEKEWNLQPMVNLLGSFLKWQTVEATEDLYKDGINSALYKGYMRDEVYSFGIRFVTKEGYKTSVFPLMNRATIGSDIIEYSNKDIDSILENSPQCSVSDRKYNWQFYNTAKVLGDSYTDIIYPNPKIITKSVEENCIQENVKILTEDTIEIEIDETYYNLNEWIMEHRAEICVPTSDYYNEKICELLTDDITEECDVSNIFSFPICNDCSEAGTCDVPVKENSELYISEIINEKNQLLQKRYPFEIDDGRPTYEHTYSDKCYQFSPANDSPKYDLKYWFIDDSQWGDSFELRFIKNRLDVYDNNSCNKSAQLGYTGNFFNTDYTGNILVKSRDVGGGALPTQYYNYYLENTNKDIVETPSVNPLDKTNILTDVIAPSYPGFEDFIHTKALWFEVDFSEQSEFLLEITPSINGSADSSTLIGDDIRLTIYDKCNTLNILYSSLYKSDQGYWKLLKKSDFGKNKVFICLDTKLKTETLAYETRKDYCMVEIKTQFIHTSTIPYCFDIKIRPTEYYKNIISFDKLSINKKTLYTSECRFNAPIDDDCGVIPHKYGMFAYWESVEDYPDNQDLYNSSDFKLDFSKLNHEDLELLDIFEDNYIQSTDENNNIIWKENESKSSVDFTCEPIRHFKFPDNSIIPFMTTLPLLNFSKSKIYPIGVTINEDTIQVFLDAAVQSGLIDLEQRSKISGYEIYRGDRTVNKSIIMKGILNDMYQDPRDSNNNQKSFFRNFPYNSLGKNQFVTQDSERQQQIQHPYSSIKNDRFSFIAPEVYYNKPKSPFEMSIDGYVYGNSLSKFVDVQDHSEWVILGEKAYSLAQKLAIAEATLEAAMTFATLTIQSSQNYWFEGGLTFGGNPIGAGVSIAAVALYLTSELINLLTYKIPKLKTQWLEIFENRGSVYNFGSMYVSSKSLYNYFVPNLEKGDMLRGLVTSKYLSNGVDVTTETDDNSSSITIINNKDREESIYLYTGIDYPVKYPEKYINYDNSDTSSKNSSRYIASQNGCENDSNSLRKIASPYVTLKNYVPDQYGKIDEIKWLSLNHDPKIKEDTSKNIFGGDIFISRVDLKNKVKLFNKNAIGLVNRTAFKYSKASNIGYTRFYVDHKSADESIGTIDMPYLSSEYNLDCRPSYKKFYEGVPSKFYLYAYAIPNFLTESEINSNLRYSGTEYHEQFASQGLNVEEWVQEKNVSIAYNNIFYYNSVYSRNQTGLPYRILPAYYDRSKWDCLSEAENGIAWSEPDNSEVSLSDPWLIFRPFNIYRFPFSYGKLISLNAIESVQVMGRFSDNMAVFNAVDVLRDRITPENEELGTGGIFAERPVQFSFTELGETGSQNRSMVSTEFGHFWTDAKRGKVFQLQPNAKGLNVISDFKSKGDESGMRKWFKRHLPFKILKSNVTNLTEKDIDNPFKGLGILMWWDSRFKRVFITKKDYTIKPTYKNLIYFESGKFFEQGNPEEIELTDPKYFKDVSWTLAYSPIYQSWISYYDFKPNYAIALNDYFQTGVNYSSLESETGVWSHLITNKSYQVFYGKYYPWEIELPIKNTYTNNVLQDLKIWSISQRYHDNFDYAVWRKKSFNKIVIYNQTNNSGLLHLNYDDSMNKSKYPLKINSTEQGIQATHHDEQISVNYFYNRVRKEDFHVPIWNSDENEINKDLNPNIISFNSKKVLERMRGDWFTVRLIQDNTSQFKQYFKWMISKEQGY